MITEWNLYKYVIWMPSRNHDKFIFSSLILVFIFPACQVIPILHFEWFKILDFQWGRRVFAGRCWHSGCVCFRQAILAKKHVLVEFPLATSAPPAQALLDSAKEHGKLVDTIYSRYPQPIKSFKELTASLQQISFYQLPQYLFKWYQNNFLPLRASWHHFTSPSKNWTW